MNRRRALRVARHAFRDEPRFDIVRGLVEGFGIVGGLLLLILAIALCAAQIEDCAGAVLR